MIIPSNFLDQPNAWGCAANLYLDAYVSADGSTLLLPKRTLADVRDARRLHHFPWWNSNMHADYRRTPDRMPLNQYEVLDDGWAAATFELIRTQFPHAREAATRVTMHLWYNILFWASYQAGHGFVTTHEYTAQVCGCSVALVCRVTNAMMEAGLIHRKWIGNGLGHFGSCYMAGPANNIDILLENAGKKLDEGV